MKYIFIGLSIHFVLALIFKPEYAGGFGLAAFVIGISWIATKEL